MIFNIKNIFKKKEEEKEKENEYKINNFRDIYMRTYINDPKNISFVLKNKIDKKTSEMIEVTIEEFVTDIKDLGNGLEKLNKENFRYGLITNNRYEWPLIYLTITSGLGSIVPLDFALPDDELIKSINRIELDILFYTKKHEKVVEKIIKEKLAPSLKYYILIDNVRTKEEKIEIKPEFKEKIMALKDVMAEGKKVPEDIANKFFEKEIDTKKDAIYSFTSATTSESKIVILCQNNLCKNLEGIKDRFPVIGNEDRFLSFLAIHHSFESTVGQLFPISIGAKIAYADSLRTVGKNIKEYNVSAMIVVPAVMDVIHKQIFDGIKKSGKLKEFAVGKATSNTLLKLGIDKRRVIFKNIIDAVGPNLNLVVSGAAGLNPKVHKDLTELGLCIMQGYGLTETSPVVAAGDPREMLIYGSIGKSLKNVIVKIDEPNEEGIGELIIKGENLFKGYYNNDKANENSFTKDGFFRTGDLGYMDKNENIFISGRIKNVIVLKNGKNVFPEETQSLIDRIPGVIESFVFGYNIENPKDPKIIAKIVYDEEEFKGKDIKEIYNFLWDEVKKINKTQPQYKYVKDIIINNKPLIRTTTRKIKLYEELKVSCDQMVSEGK